MKMLLAVTLASIFLAGCVGARHPMSAAQQQEFIAQQQREQQPAQQPAPQDKPLFDCAEKFPVITGVRTAYESWQKCKGFANKNQLAQVNEANLPGSPERQASDLERIEIETGTTAEDNEERRKDNIVAAAQVMEGAHPYRLNGLTAATIIANQ